MFSLFDLELLCADEEKLRSFLQKYGMLSSPPSSCSTCGGPVTDVQERRGKPHVRCKRKGCRIWISCATSSLLEGCHLSFKTLLYLFYFWSHDSAGSRAVNMLGLDAHTVALWSQRLRICVANAEAAAERPLGGKGYELECDECEVGRAQKGMYGHKTVVKGDIWGVRCRSSGKVILELFDKWQKGDEIERRFGPPSVEDVEALCLAKIKKGSILFTDGARCYAVVAKKAGFFHDYVDHGNGVYAKSATVDGKVRRVHTNGIDGCWGRLKTWINSRGGIKDHLLWDNMKEFQWRYNLPVDADPFLCLLDAVRNGHFPF